MKQLLPILIIFCSCTSTNKHKTVTSTKVDSVSHVKTDSSTLKSKVVTQVKKQQVIVKKKADVTTVKETIYNFDTSHINGSEYFNDNGNHIPVTGKLVSVTKREKTIDKTKTTTKADLKDSVSAAATQTAAVTKTADTELHKEVKVKDKVVKRISFNWWWLLLLIPLYLIYRYRKQIPYLNILFK